MQLDSRRIWLRISAQSYDPFLIFNMCMHINFVITIYFFVCFVGGRNIW
jgi:hypothetical protein